MCNCMYLHNISPQIDVLCFIPYIVSSSTSQPPFNFTTAPPPVNVSTVAPPVIPVNFLRFGLDVGDSVVPLADDGSSQEIRLNTDFVFFGRRETGIFVSNILPGIQYYTHTCTTKSKDSMGEWDKHTHTHVQVNTNGDLSFGSSYTSTGPQTFPTFSPPLIAPFFHDIDIRNGGTIYYRQTSDPMDIISVITTLQILPNLLIFTPTSLFIATWDRVAPFSSVGSPSDRNTFQVILATDGFTSTVIFNYGDIQWGERADIGFNAGDG